MQMQDVMFSETNFVLKDSPQSCIIVSESESGSPELNIVSDPESWRKEVSQTLIELQERIRKLELKASYDDRPPSKKMRRNMSSQVTAYTTYGTYGLEGIPTCIRLVKTTRAALLQCVWLFVCVFAFTWIGVSQFIRARSNEKSEWKPEKIAQVHDYSRITSKQYEMPNVYIFFEASSLEENSNWLNVTNLNNVLENMKVSQNFNDSVGLTYLTAFDTIQSSATVVEAEITAVKVLSNDKFHGCMKIRLGNPDPSIGSAWFWVHLTPDNLTLNNTVHIVGFWVYIARDLQRLSLNKVLYLAGRDAIDNVANVSYNVGYKEEIHYSLKSDQPSYRFKCDLLWSTDYLERWVGEDKHGLSMTFRGDELVETWEEYVDFSYIDWIFAMGGMLSLLTFWFFFVAYNIARILGDNDSLGILPGLSIVFRNLEMLSIIKKELEEKEILLLAKMSETDADEFSFAD